MRLAVDYGINDAALGHYCVVVNCCSYECWLAVALDFDDVMSFEILHRHDADFVESNCSMSSVKTMEKSLF